jgi:hypothetical protein
MREGAMKNFSLPSALVSLLLAALLFLTTAATAYAECAWVVWRQTLSDNPAIPPSGNWIAEGAFKSKEECVRDIKQKHGVYFGEANLEGYTYTRGAYCLPDTVDPRGPKR